MASVNRPVGGVPPPFDFPLRRMPARRRWLAALPALALAPGVAFGAVALPGLRESHWRRALAGADSVWEGGGENTLHVFFDAACPACDLLYERTRRPLHQARCRLQWIPVALLGGDSLERAAQLLAAADRQSALPRIFRGDLMGTSGWREKCAAVDANCALLRLLAGGRMATPGLVIDRLGSALRFELGLPADPGA